MKIQTLGSGHTQILVALPDGIDLDVQRIDGTNVLIVSIPGSNDDVLGQMEDIAKMPFATARDATNGAVSSAATHTRLRNHFGLTGGGQWVKQLRQEKESVYGRTVQTRLLNLMRTVGFSRLEMSAALDKANAAFPGKSELSSLAPDDQQVLDQRRKSRYKKKPRR